MFTLPTSQHGIAQPDPFLLASWSASVGATEAAAALQMAVILAGAAGAQAVAGGAWEVAEAFGSVLLRSRSNLQQSLFFDLEGGLHY